MSTTSTANTPLVAVTGGAGFIGSHTVDRLIDGGCRVVVLDDFSTGKWENLARWKNDARLEVLTVDISDGIFAALAPVTARLGTVDRIVHLAAQTAVTHSIVNPIMDARVNYVGTLQVLEYARAFGIKKVVFASSAAVYGDVTERPVHEGLETRPLSPYGIDKRASEMLLYYYAAVHGVATTPLRFFNVYGPRQDPASPYSGVISIFADRAMANRDITIFGDGEQTRDFIYVGDISRAIVSACMSDAGNGTPMNLGTGHEITINQLASAIIEQCGSSSTVAHADARAGEIRNSVASIERAATLLPSANGDSYVVSRVPLAEGMAKTLDWVRSSQSSV